MWNAAVLLMLPLPDCPPEPFWAVTLFQTVARPKRHWPATQGSQSASLDAAYYKHMMPSVLKGLSSAINAGELGSNVRGGEIFLLRRYSTVSRRVMHGGLHACVTCYVMCCMLCDVLYRACDVCRD